MAAADPFGICHYFPGYLAVGKQGFAHPWAAGLVFDSAGIPALSRLRWREPSARTGNGYRELAVFRIDQFRPRADAASALRDRLTALFTSRRSQRPIDPRLVQVTELALVVALAAVMSSVFWNLFGPVTRPSTLPRATAAPASAQPAAGPIDPFRVASQVAAASDAEIAPGADLAETTLNLVLHGTWIDEKGGAAFIQAPDGKQGRFSVGEAISPGVTLERVFRDQIVINRSGVRESLRLINRETTSQSTRTSAQPVSADTNKTTLEGSSNIGDIINAAPRIDETGAAQLVLAPANDRDGFERLGLRTGDVLVAVGNQPISGDVVKGLAMIADLEGKKSITLSIKRGGVVMPLTISLSGPTQELDD